MNLVGDESSLKPVNYLNQGFYDAEEYSISMWVKHKKSDSDILSVKLSSLLTYTGTVFKLLYSTTTYWKLVTYSKQYLDQPDSQDREISLTLSEAS